MTMMKPKEMAERLGVTVRTLQIWDKKGILKAYRTPTNRRYYTEEQYLEYTGQPLQNKRLNVAYARVSNNSQKDDLKNQISFIRQYVNAKGVILDDVITDIGSGLNYNRKNWNKLLEKVMQNEIDTIYITYKDRFVRFGYEWFERLCKMHDTKIVVLNNVETSPTQEMINDMVSIVQVFSGRLSGLRKYQTKIQNDKSLKGGELGDPNAKGQAVSEQNDAKGD
ncbi:putative site-specific integrase-resolvase [Limosilactobacillus mucosae]|jgi:predicted site-specific integrase-resolvase|uniref:IS607 family transposase n=1 Tax=Limosilactobacillus mucosae TaxID=97478 RepID=UPI00053C449D|nr:IS607 family transposase [Limosilactobacillus mucosae]MDE8677999.1 IS607 family transposase [Limosilactobacillus mucosae]PWJ45878.1 putative site-specific integrase-resolvase [Limosilactobacillus mucosae]RXA58482.1 IS607 family transposase [Limosilactobacillus mucosae]UNL60899.1 IS607 family transposase [Limosilactobacillus mucosae]SUQ20163.1 Predicted site-specific integrase-resolvase [Limosilactobacillus mucosae]